MTIIDDLTIAGFGSINAELVSCPHSKHFIMLEHLSFPVPMFFHCWNAATEVVCALSDEEISQVLASLLSGKLVLPHNFYISFEWENRGAISELTHAFLILLLESYLDAGYLGNPNDSDRFKVSAETHWERRQQAFATAVGLKSYAAYCAAIEYLRLPPSQKVSSAFPPSYISEANSAVAILESYCQRMGHLNAAP